MQYTIGRPSPKAIAEQTERVKAHLDRWRAVEIGRVHWETVTYRAGGGPVEVPHRWELKNPSEWVRATRSATIAAEYRRLGELVQQMSSQFHALVVRRRQLVMERPVPEVIKAAEVALTLFPGCAQGRPLRALGVCNIDTKFFERNRALICQMLDVRFEGQVGELGLEHFLGAAEEDERWLLVAPLASGMLPFRQQRVRASELSQLAAVAGHVVIVENERSLHQLPELPGTVAILGAGLSLGWVRDAWLTSMRVAYWGDMDTWGLSMLARVRLAIPSVAALLMDQDCFDQYAPELAVCEPTPVDGGIPDGLTLDEGAFFAYLLTQERGRLEQEFLPKELVSKALCAWQGR
uniref:Conserved hypothethical protein n=1 Tax=Ralstonia syzygii R24 TaxID=907261 RepID=G3AB01_9RALS|nr:conserved hypothethical protein [Ralstonia syzygii R24]